MVKFMSELWMEIDVDLLREIIRYVEENRKISVLHDFYKAEANKTSESFKALRRKGVKRPQKTKCWLCDKEIEGHAIKEDHDHLSGEFRGWLCNSCNAGLGFVESFLRRDLMDKVIQYLKK